MSRTEALSQHPSLLVLVQGALWMITAGLAFTLSGSAVKMLSTRLPPVEVAFFRSLFGLLIVVAAWRAVVELRRIKDPAWHAVRGVLGVLSLLCMVAAFSYLPLAVVFAVFTGRIFLLIMFAAILCAERPGRTVWIASWLGVVGVAISLWPQLRTAVDDDLELTEAGMGAMFVCGAALFSAGSQTAVRRLTDTNTPATIVLVFSVFSIVALCAPATWSWVPPKPGDWPVLAAVGMLAAAAQWCTARSYARIGAARAAPVDLMQIPVSAVVGWVLFAEVPTGWGVSGALTIMAARSG